MGEDVTTVVAVRIEDVIEPVRGSQEGRCSACLAPVWLAPLTMRAMLQVRTRVLCEACILAHWRETAPVEPGLN